MTTKKPAHWADLFDLILLAAKGVIPRPVLDDLIARIEVRP